MKTATAAESSVPTVAPVSIAASKSTLKPEGCNRDAGPSESECESASESQTQSRLYDVNFFLAFTSQTCFVIANTLMAHYARWIEFLGGSLSQIGWVMGAGAAAGLFLRPWLAQFINRMGSKATWAMGYGVFSSAAFGNFWLGEIGPAIYVMRAATVLGAAMVFASSLTYISQMAPDHRRTEAIGILGVGGFVGMLIGPLLGDVFLGSDVRQRYDFLQLFAAAGLANLIPGTLLFFVRSPEKSPTVRRASMKITEFMSTVRAHWPGSIVWIDLAFGACMTVPFGFLASFVDEAALKIPGFSVVGFFFLFYAGIGILFRVGLRKLPDRIGPQRVLFMGAVVMSAGMFAFSLVGPDRAWMIALPATLCGTGHSLMFHTMTSLTIAPFPKESRGTGSALALMLLDLGTFAGAPILGLIGEMWGYSVLFATVGLFCMLCTARFYFHRAAAPIVR